MNRSVRTSRPRPKAHKRSYDASSRRAEAERTASRIVAAATELLKGGVRPEHISYAEVGARAGVAPRTVYRHFPETTELLQAIAAATLDRFTDGRLAYDPPGVATQLGQFHELMCADPQLFQVFIGTPLRSGMDYENFLKGVFADALAPIPARHRDAAAATIEMLANPYAWEVLHSHWGLPRAQITRTCLAAIQAVVDRFQREPELLDPAAPLPALFRDAAAAGARRPTRPARRKTSQNTSQKNGHKDGHKKCQTRKEQR